MALTNSSKDLFLPVQQFIGLSTPADNSKLPFMRLVICRANLKLKSDSVTIK